MYEAWIIYYSDTQDAIQKTTFCGLPVCTRYAESAPYVSCITESHAQHDLSAMTQDAIQGYQATHKRSFPSRLLRGSSKSYEADLDARIRKLPRPVQSELDGLLGDRESATCNRFHKRDWTVAMMREQYRYRFASAAYEEVKKSNKRFWKKGGAKRPSEYFFIIRGANGRVAADDKGMQTATRHGNPWKHVDATEQLRRQSARDIRHYGKDYEHLRARPRDRSFSPAPRRVRVESEGPSSPRRRFSTPFAQNRPYDLPPPPPPLGPFAQHYGPRPGAWHDVYAASTMPRTYPYLGNMAQHPYPPPPPPPPPPMSPSPYVFSGMACRPPPPLPPPMSVPMCPPPPFPRPPMHQPPMTHNFPSAYPVENPFVSPEPLADFDFDAFLAPGVPLGLSPSMGLPPPPSPPPAPRLSNLTTPTTFSRPSTAPSMGSSVDGTEVSTPVDGVSVELRVGEEGSRGGSVFGE